ncbi:hypothetical protein [Comamonas sp. Z3]|uniref:hypothetical protein n=1 Tax=Comamonas sp. Z3 TaxID=2601247 RepID=UPI0016532CAC|nr:hypothetical protein [Comamonas sp. Z3]
MKKLSALAAVVAVAASLGGCIVAPHDGYYGHGHGGRYDSDRGGRYEYEQNDRDQRPNRPDRRPDDRWRSQY